MADVNRIERLEEDADTADHSVAALSAKVDELNKTATRILYSLVTGAFLVAADITLRAFS